MTTVYVNGRISDARDAVVSVLDHGFLYGEGVYETLRTYIVDTIRNHPGSVNPMIKSNNLLNNALAQLPR